MARYRNGDIPDHLLIRRGNFLLTAGTWAKWDCLVADVLARFGVRLEITDGLGVLRGTGAFRARLMQRQVKAHFVSIGQGRLAAAEGTSSHGGEFNGADALAIDVNNYARIPLAEFYAAARRAGFEPGYFNGRNGRPYEPWHLIDWEPYRAVPKPPARPAGGASEPAAPTTKEIIMATEVIVTEKDNNGKLIADRNRRVAFVNTESGFSCDFSWLTLADADKWAKQVGMPAGALRFSDAGFDKFIGRLS